MTTKNITRDVAIYKSFMNKVPIKKLCEIHDLSGTRIRQIIDKMLRIKPRVGESEHPWITQYNSLINNMNINIYTKSNCPNCVAAKQLLTSKKLDYFEIDVELGNRWQNLIQEFPDARQMPQVFINDQRVGGLSGLQAALKQLGL